MSRIFISHASSENAAALALRDWLVAEGWNDLFLDVDAERGLKAGQRWQAALKAAAERCELVIFLISPEWARSKWCLAEFLLAKTLNKRVLGIVVEPTPLAELPVELTAEWQLADLTAGARDRSRTVELPPNGQRVEVRFASTGLDRLRTSLQHAGLDARYFEWPPAGDPRRPPYRGLRPLETEDAGIFFGREAPIIKVLDQLRGLREAPAPRILVILGASGAGKSSFLRAGLLPRLKREDRAFLVLPIVRPERAALTGEDGLLRALEAACDGARLSIARADLRAALIAGGQPLAEVLQRLVDAARRSHLDATGSQKPPTLVLSIDQAEELFLAEAQEEARAFLDLLRALIVLDRPEVIAVCTIRSDHYEHLQVAPQLEGFRQETFSLPPMPKGAYAELIKGPARRLDGTTRALQVEDALIDALLADVEIGAAKDALPLLAFTLERLYDEYHAGGELLLKHYEALGRVKGSIEVAVERAFKVADGNAAIPRDRQARLALLRHGLIPWLAGIDPESGTPRRRVARLLEIPAESRPLIDLLVEQRLLATDVAKDTGEITIEPAHEALLRQWSLLQGWLTEDSGLLAVMDAVKRAAKDWNQGGRGGVWLTHVGDRLDAAERLSDRPDLAGLLEPLDRDYLAACRTAERLARERERSIARNRQRMRAAVGVLLLGIIAGLVGWINQDAIKERANWFMVMQPYMNSQIRPYVLSDDAERSLKPMDPFRECARDCAEMIVLPAGSFVMGSPDSEKGRGDDEGPQHTVTVPSPFAISVAPVTFAEWDACVAVGGCPQVTESAFGRGTQPVINVSWIEAQQYVAWFARMTGKPYRLLSEAEWEYAARAGTTTQYPWGDDVGTGNANCIGCGSQWDNRRTAPVRSFKPNTFGIYDAVGNVWIWLQDCYHDSYQGAPSDASPWVADCEQGRRAVRGGAWDSIAVNNRIANRDRISLGTRINDLGFRLARSLPGLASSPSR